MKRKTIQSSGFTLVEIMIVVAIIGLIATIAIPNFIQARTKSRKNACIANLRQVTNAKLVWAQELRKSQTDIPVDADLFGSDKYLRDKPYCPANGVYSYNMVSSNVTCSLGPVEGHTLGL